MCVCARVRCYVAYSIRAAFVFVCLCVLNSALQTSRAAARTFAKAFSHRIPVNYIYQYYPLSTYAAAADASDATATGRGQTEGLLRCTPHTCTFAQCSDALRAALCPRINHTLALKPHRWGSPDP